MLISPKNDLGFIRTRRGRYPHGLRSTDLPLNSFTSSRKGPHICTVLGAQWRDSSFQGGFNYWLNRTTLKSLNKTVFPLKYHFSKASFTQIFEDEPVPLLRLAGPEVTSRGTTGEMVAPDQQSV